MIPGAMSEINVILSDLLARTGASRVTLRQDEPGQYAFPVTHESLCVHLLPSSQVIGVWRQPTVGSQLSVVHLLLSSQLTLDWKTQVPMEQTLLVHLLPSSQVVPSVLLV